MSVISIRAVNMAIEALKQGLREHASYPHLLTTRDGVIQRFEFVVDISRQLLVRVLKDVFHLSEATVQKDTFREAAKLELVESVERWIAHINACNRTSHSYDAKVAELIFAHVLSVFPMLKIFWSGCVLMLVDHNKIDIRADHLQIVRDILQKHVPQYEVWVFGSRVKGTAKQYSDLDLCIKASTSLDFQAMALLQEDFAESDLPWKVDIVDWAVTSTEFLSIIEQDKVVLQASNIQTK